VEHRHDHDGGTSSRPFEFVNVDGAAPMLLLCDHASNRVPSDLDALGLNDRQLASHIAWDIGAADVVRELARLLDAPAVLSRTSRLVVDANRRPGTGSLIPEEVDGSVVPGNLGLSEADRDRRVERFHHPYHRAIAERLEAMGSDGSVPTVVSIHSFTPVMNGMERPWQIGILSGVDRRLSLHLISHLRAEGLVVGDNEPYSGSDVYGYTVNQHAESTGLPNVTVELRQDLIATPHSVVDWAERLARTLGARPENAQRCVPFSTTPANASGF